PGLLRPERAFVAGLLHGIGRLALELVAPRAMARIMQLAAHEGVSGAVAERRVLGLDAHDAGRRLGERWGLPGDIIAVIAWHDDPSAGDPEHADLVRLVGLAKWACRWYLLGWSGDWHEPGDARSWCEGVGLRADAPRELMPEIIGLCGQRLGDLGFRADRGARGGGGFSGADMAVLIAEQANRRLAVRRNAVQLDSRVVVPPGTGCVPATNVGLIGL
ncbi:MAG: HDOD domain-containing protein, partial [Phycisphaerales bacterium]|nr:HDOD domain-containing protein [Phycisphaerales bacterium]